MNVDAKDGRMIDNVLHHKAMTPSDAAPEVEYWVNCGGIRELTLKLAPLRYVHKKSDNLNPRVQLSRRNLIL